MTLRTDGRYHNIPAFSSKSAGINIYYILGPSSKVLFKCYFSRRGASYKYPQHFFYGEIRKNISLDTSLI